jgi:hypothetical protein
MVPPPVTVMSSPLKTIMSIGPEASFCWLSASFSTAPAAMKSVTPEGMRSA